LRLEQATIAEWQGASEDQKYVASQKPILQVVSV
jgi:hypothetical protein